MGAAAVSGLPASLGMQRPVHTLVRIGGDPLRLGGWPLIAVPPSCGCTAVRVERVKVAKGAKGLT